MTVTVTTVYLLIVLAVGAPAPLILDAFTTLTACEAFAARAPRDQGVAVCQSVPVNARSLPEWK